MFKRIGLIWKLSKKYNFQFKPLLSGDNGRYEMNGDGTDKQISVSVFSKHFEAIIFHEIGHLIAKRSLGFSPSQKYSNANQKWLFYNNQQGQVLLLEEATASKFTNRVTKGKYRDILKQWFHTYTGAFAKHITDEKLEFMESFLATVMKCEKILDGGK